MTNATSIDALAECGAQQYYYNYDVAGNRVSEQIDANVTQAIASTLNQISGKRWRATRFAGTIIDGIL